MIKKKKDRSKGYVWFFFNFSSSKMCLVKICLNICILCSAEAGMNNIISRNLLLIRLKDCWAACLSLGNKMSLSGQIKKYVRICMFPSCNIEEGYNYLSNRLLNKLLFAKQEAQGHITYLRTFFTMYKLMFIPAYWIKKKSIVLSQLPPLLGSVIRDSSDSMI